MPPHLDGNHQEPAITVPLERDSGDHLMVHRVSSIRKTSEHANCTLVRSNFIKYLRRSTCAPSHGHTRSCGAAEIALFWQLLRPDVWGDCSTPERAWTRHPSSPRKQKITRQNFLFAGVGVAHYQRMVIAFHLPVLRSLTGERFDKVADLSPQGRLRSASRPIHSD
jgi:hypothetical protein